MSTATSPLRHSAPFLASRAALAAVLAVVVTFSPDHTVGFGLVVLGGYLIVQSLVLVAGVGAFARTRRGRALVLVRAAVSLGGGVLALVLLAGDVPVNALVYLEALVFLALGALELIGGLRRAEAPQAAGDAVVVGGLQVLVGLMLLILDRDPVLAVGVLGAWGAVVAVYLGIAAASWRRAGERR